MKIFENFGQNWANFDKNALFYKIRFYSKSQGVTGSFYEVIWPIFVVFYNDGHNYQSQSTFKHK